MVRLVFYENSTIKAFLGGDKSEYYLIDTTPNTYMAVADINGTRVPVEINKKDVMLVLPDFYNENGIKISVFGLGTTEQNKSRSPVVNDTKK